MPQTQTEIYQEHLQQLNGRPLLGEQEIGDLTLSCNYKRWKLKDAHGYEVDKGNVTTGAVTRDRIRAAVLRWAKKNPIVAITQ